MHPILDRRLVPGALARLALVAALAGAVVAGCSHRDAAPSEASAGAASLLAPNPWTGGLPSARWRGLGRSHMPLEVGNRWDYRVQVSTRILSTGRPDQVDAIEYPWSTEVVGVGTFGAREYFMVASYDPRVMMVESPIPMREDATGLYERDVIVAKLLSDGSTPRDGRADACARALEAALARGPADPALAAAAKRLVARVASVLGEAGEPNAGRQGPDAEEIALLRYPLRPGAEWDVRKSPRFTRRVVGRDLVRVPAGRFIGWRIAGGGELFGPHDRVHAWYARQGLVRLVTHLETEATDASGNVIGLLVYDMDQTLTGLRFHPVRAY